MKKETNQDIIYAQHNPFYHSLQNDINQIREINKIIRAKPQEIHNFYSLINTLFVNHRHYISSAKHIEEMLNKVQTNIYSNSFLSQLDKKKKSNEFIRYLIKLIMVLEKILQQMYKDFSDNNILPKVMVTKKRNPSNAILNQ